MAAIDIIRVSLVLLGLAFNTARGKDAVPPVVPPPTVFLHLSDIHMSTNVRKYWHLFGNREGDALLFAEGLVPRLGLAAAVVTGDLTDSKTVRGEGLQQEAEWQAYGGLLRKLGTGGLPLGRVYDLPGNHDTFNMPARGGSNDFFRRYAAEGQRRPAPAQRVFVHRLAQGPGINSQGQAADEGEDCSAAWLLGIDVTPEPGLRSPANFAGLAGPAIMNETRTALGRIAREQPQRCGPPVVVAYLHYPLSTVDSSPRHLSGPLGTLLHAGRTIRPMQGLTQLLAEHNVLAVLSGHLHAAFGQRMHRLHATPAGGLMAELETAAWKDDRRFRLVAVDGGSLSFMDLFFHTRNAPLMPRRPDATAMQGPGWRDAYEQRGWAVTALEPSAAVVEHLAVITRPADARYSPLGAPQAVTAAAAEGSAEGDEPDSTGWVRVLVFALDGEAQPGGGLEVEVAAYLPAGAHLFTKPMQLERQPQQTAQLEESKAAAPLLFAAQTETTIICVGEAGNPAAHCRPPSDHVMIQVNVKGASGRVSRSQLQPAALQCRALTPSHQSCWVARSSRPLPLRTSSLEWLGLAFNWPVLVHRMFLAVLGFQTVGLLVLPRLLRSQALPLIAGSPLLQCRPVQAALAVQEPSGRRLLRACISYLLWPWAALFICADATGIWCSMLAYNVFLLMGPWLAYPALIGYPPALMFHYGVFGRLGPAPADQAHWRFIGTPDTMFVSLVHLLFCLLPATLWVACVVARRVQLQPYSPASSRSSSSENAISDPMRRRAGEAGASASRSGTSFTATGGGTGMSWCFSSAQVAAFLAIAALNCSTLYLRAWSLMSGISLAFSPGFAWTLPLALLLVTVWDGPRRRCGLVFGKGE